MLEKELREWRRSMGYPTESDDPAFTPTKIGNQGNAGYWESRETRDPIHWVREQIMLERLWESRHKWDKSTHAARAEMFELVLEYLERERIKGAKFGRVANRARNKKLTPEQRSEIARLAAKARWERIRNDENHATEGE